MPTGNGQQLQKAGAAATTGGVAVP